MPVKRKPFATDIFDQFTRLRTTTNLNRMEVGNQLRELYPAIFGGMKGKSIVEAVQEQATEQDYDIFRGKPGAQPQVIPENDSRWHDENPILTVPYCDNILIISDLHVPLHSVEYLQRVVDTIKVKQVKTVVFNGDLFDNGHRGHSGFRSHWNPRFDEGIAAMRDIMALLMDQASVTQILALCGNHDDKTFRASDREMEFKDHFQKMVTPVDTSGVSIKTTNRYYIDMIPKTPKAWPFDGPDNFPNKFTHQKEYSRIPGSVEIRLANVEPANTYAGHHHHLSITHHISSLYVLVGCGTGQDPRLAAYKNARQSTHPKWDLGFITISHNVPKPWRIGNSEEWWEEQLSC